MKPPKYCGFADKGFACSEVWDHEGDHVARIEDGGRILHQWPRKDRVFELRKVTRSKRLSEETDCFEADVWIDGVRAGGVANRGTGGPNMYSSPALEARLEAHAKTLPLITPDEGEPFPASAETFIGDLLEEFLLKKELAAILRKQVVAVENGKLMSYKPRAGGSFDGVIRQLTARGLKLLNLMPFSEAVETYRRLA